jgi:hypothetical protein
MVYLLSAMQMKYKNIRETGICHVKDLNVTWAKGLHGSVCTEAFSYVRRRSYTRIEPQVEYICVSYILQSWLNSVLYSIMLDCYRWFHGYQ